LDVYLAEIASAVYLRARVEVMLEWVAVEYELIETLPNMHSPKFEQVNPHKRLSEEMPVPPFVRVA